MSHFCSFVTLVKYIKKYALNIHILSVVTFKIPLDKYVTTKSFFNHCAQGFAVLAVVSVADSQPEPFIRCQHQLSQLHTAKVEPRWLPRSSRSPLLRPTIQTQDI